MPKESGNPSGGEWEEESKEPREDRGSREGRVVNVIQQNAVIVNGRRAGEGGAETEEGQSWI